MKSKIKWIKNSRVKKNSKISCQDILEKESDAQAGEVIVSMTNITKKHPTLNIKFPSLSEVKENKILTSGKWITKSWLETKQVIATVNMREDYIHFNRTRFTPDQLNEVIKVINEVKETV
tara:strand:+ start:262 stop:621 length:360 start_codon:yes stop_codon:yes gene_type:complete